MPDAHTQELKGLIKRTFEEYNTGWRKRYGSDDRAIITTLISYAEGDKLLVLEALTEMALPRRFELLPAILSSMLNPKELLEWQSRLRAIEATKAAEAAEAVAIINRDLDEIRDNPKLEVPEAARNLLDKGVLAPTVILKQLSLRKGEGKLESVACEMVKNFSDIQLQNCDPALVNAINNGLYKLATVLANRIDSPMLTQAVNLLVESKNLGDIDKRTLRDALSNEAKEKAGMRGLGAPVKVVLMSVIKKIEREAEKVSALATHAAAGAGVAAASAGAGAGRSAATVGTVSSTSTRIADGGAGEGSTIAAAAGATASAGIVAAGAGVAAAAGASSTDNSTTNRGRSICKTWTDLIGCGRGQGPAR